MEVERVKDLWDEVFPANLYTTRSSFSVRLILKQTISKILNDNVYLSSNLKSKILCKLHRKQEKWASECVEAVVQLKQPCPG